MGEEVEIFSILLPLKIKGASIKGFKTSW